MKSIGDSSEFTELIRLVRCGDQSAAEQLVARYEPFIRRELRIRMIDQRLSRHVDSFDICQSLWSSFFARMATGQFDLEGPQQLSKLLVVMARNKLASQARRQLALKRDVRRTEPDQVLTEVPDECDTPSSHVSAQEIMDKILSNLSEEERQLSDLRRVGLSWDEVATRMGGTAQARRMQLDRAADRIIAQLGLND